MCYLCSTTGYVEGGHPLHFHVGSNPVAFTGPSTDYVDALLADYSWTGTTGVSADITYSFDGTLFDPPTATALSSAQQDATRSALEAWGNVANISFTEIGDDSADILINQDDLDTGIAGLAWPYVFTDFPDIIARFEVQVDESLTDLSAGGFGYLVILHEIGHALGLKHPGDYGSDSGPFLSAEYEHIQNTVMSYNNGPLLDEVTNPPETPMIYDIAAIQFLYGANTDYNSGNTAYSYDGSSTALTIWDGGGTDTISAASYSGGGVTIDLTAGEDNITQIGSTYVWIAFDANIEDATGSDDNDTLLGNSLANYIMGNDGADSIDGNGGTDTLDGGSGDDLIYYSADDQTIYGGMGEDTFEADEDLIDELDGDITISIKDFDSDDDTIDLSGLGYVRFSQITVTETSEDTITLTFGTFGDFNGEYLTILLENDEAIGTIDADSFIFAEGGTTQGGDGDDLVVNDGEVKGGDGSDTVIGGTGADTLYGGEALADTDDSADTITGGAGNDLAFGNSGDDIIYADDTAESSVDGNDNVYGGLGLDTIYGGGGNDLLAGGGGIEHPTDEADSILGGSGDDIIVGNGDNDTLIGGADTADTDDGNDWILGGLGNDLIYGSGGNDTLTGQTGDDTLNGGEGNDIFLFWDNNGSDVITDFDAENDTIAIWNGLSSGLNSVSALDIFEIGDDVLFSLGNGNSITVQNSTADDVAGRIVFSDVFTDYFAQFLTLYDAAAMDFS